MLRVGRNREKNKRLPTGWAPAKSGAIYFRPTNAGDKAIVKGITGGPLSILLGASEADAHESPLWRRILSERKQNADVMPGTVAELVDRARRHYLPRIENPETRAWRARHIDALEKLFGSKRYARNVHEATKSAPGAVLVALDVQRHIDENRHRAKAANREAKTWGIVFAEARRRWGLTEYNPCQGLDFNPEPAREVLPDDADILKVYRHLDAPMRFAVVLGRYYGRRRGEILKLPLSAAHEDGLHLVRGKRPKPIIIRWDARLRKAWARLMRWRAEHVRGGKVMTTAAMLNRLGAAYTTTGFNSAWRRARERAGLAEAFNFHDLRAAKASASRSIEEAQAWMGHDERGTTERIYRRGPLVLAEFPNDSRNSRKGRS